MNEETLNKIKEWVEYQEDATNIGWAVNSACLIEYLETLVINQNQ